MLYREIIAECSQIHTKHINTAVWAERRISEYKIWRYHWALQAPLKNKLSGGPGFTAKLGLSV